MARLYTPREFAELKTEALKMGFRHVESGRWSAPAITPTSKPHRRGFRWWRKGYGSCARNAAGGLGAAGDSLI